MRRKEQRSRGERTDGWRLITFCLWIALSPPTLFAEEGQPPSAASQPLDTGPGIERAVEWHIDPIEPDRVKTVETALQSNATKVTTLRVTTTTDIQQRVGFDAEGPVIKRTIQTLFAADDRGRIRSQQAGGAPGRIGTTEVRQQRQIGAYDGKLLMYLQGRDEYDWGYLGPDKSRLPREVDPRNYLFSFHHDPVTELLEKKQYRILGTWANQGHAYIVIESSPKVVDGVAYRGRMLVDPLQDHAIVDRSLWIQFESLGTDWHRYSHTQTWDFEKTATGVRVPRRGRTTSLNISLDQARSRRDPTLAWQFDVQFTEWELNPELDDDTFRLVMPKQIFIQDERDQPARSQP